MKNKRKLSKTGHCENIGSVYNSRPLMGKGEMLRRRHLANEYGKKASPPGGGEGGIYVSPGRTMRSPV